jgi:hypothetical protein
MKKLLSILLLSSISFLTNAQETQSQPQPSATATALSSIASADDLFILTLSSDNWSGLPSDFEAKPFRSRGLSFLIMKEKMTESGHFGFGYGLGFSSQNVHTDAAILYNDSSTNSQLYKLPDSLDVDLNKLSLNFIDAAFEIRLRTSENSHDKRFKVSVGMKAGYLIQSHTKYHDINGKIKTYGLKNLNNFQYGVTARVGYGGVSASLYYSLADVFKKDKGPVLTPYSVGIAFTF